MHFNVEYRASTRPTRAYNSDDGGGGNGSDEFHRRCVGAIIESTNPPLSPLSL